MEDASTEDEESLPPEPARVAARAMILSAVAHRGLVEDDEDRQGAEVRRGEVCRWLARLGVEGELEEAENFLLRTPIGQLDRRNAVDASWRSEGMVVLAWALGRAELPRYDEPCVPSEVANELGFLAERSGTALAAPSLRAREDIEDLAGTYLAIHWRLVEYQLRRAFFDFAGFLPRWTLGPLRPSELDLIDRDLGIRGERIVRAPEESYYQTVSITQERHRAFDWLIGFEPVYSEVPTST
jgi:hypothetical protein